MKKTKAREIMTVKLVTLKPRMDVFDAIGILLENQISGAPVIDDDGIFLGVFSERSSLQALVTRNYHNSPSAQVGQFMDADARTISEDTPILDIGHIFLVDPLRRLPVLEDGKLVGQISRRDVMKAMRDLSYQEAKKEAPSTGLYLSAVHESRQQRPMG